VWHRLLAGGKRLYPCENYIDSDRITGWKPVPHFSNRLLGVAAIADDA